jgi:ABC-2 type transport system permease protein
MTGRRVGAVVLRQYYLIRGSLSRVLPLFAWVAVDMVLWGFITRYLNAVSGSGLDFVPVMLGAVLLWDFTTRVMQGVTMAFLEDVWSRNFLNLFAAPLSIPEYTAGLVLSSVATSAVGLVVMLTLSTAAFGLSFAPLGLAIVPFLFILFLSGIALGILGCAVVLRFGPAAEWFVWPIPALLSPFAGVFYPVATLPGWMQAVSALIAPSYVFEASRQILSGGGFPAGKLAAGGALALACLLLSGLAFARVCRGALRSGLIARYSAESVS